MSINEHPNTRVVFQGDKLLHKRKQTRDKEERDYQEKIIRTREEEELTRKFLEDKKNG